MTKAWWALLLIPGGCRATSHSAAQPIVPANYAAGDERRLWPLDLGNEWVYEVDATLGDRDFSYEGRMEVVRAKDGMADVDVFRREHGQDQLTTSRRYQSVASGLQAVSENGRPFTPPRSLVPYPIVFGTKAAQKVAGPVDGSEAPVDQSTTTQARGIEVAEAVDKRWEAIAIESVSEYEVGGVKTSASSVTYLAPRVGPVRIVQETRAEGQLLSREVWKLKRQTITNL